MSKCFQSLLASELEAFLTFKIGLGHSYKRKCYTLRSFDRYVAEHHRSGRRALWSLLGLGLRFDATLDCEPLHELLGENLGKLMQF